MTTELTMTREHAEVMALEALRQFRERDVWDGPPVLFMILQSGEMVFPVPLLGDDVWDGPHPVDVITTLAAAIAQAGGPPMPDPSTTIAGTGLIHEGWGISETSERPMDYWKTHRIADDPDGIEVAMVTIAGDGFTVSAQYNRGDAESRTPDITGGRVADALHLLHHALRDHPTKV